MRDLRLLRLILFSVIYVILASSLEKNVGSYSYQLSRSELRILLAKRRAFQLPEGNLQHTAVIPPNGIYTDEDRLCVSRTFTDPKTKAKYEFKFKRARCNRKHGHRQRYDVQCSITVINPRNLHPYRLDDFKFANYCPENHICQNWDYKTIDFVRRQDVICTPESEVNIEYVHSAQALPGTSASGKLHCAGDQLVPASSHYTTAKGIDFVVTEEAFWPNGTDYIAPIMVIHDKSTPYGFDRALQRDSSVISSDFVLRSIGPNQIQQRKIQFCMEMIPGKSELWVIFMYSWFREFGRKGVVPAVAADTWCLGAGTEMT